MPAMGIHHVDLVVPDVDKSLAFYVEVLGPLGLVEDSRFPSYRGTEEVVYLRFGEQLLGLRPADGGEHRYYDVDIEHIAFYVETRAESGRDVRALSQHRRAHPLPAPAGSRPAGLLRALRFRSGRDSRRGRL